MQARKDPTKYGLPNSAVDIGAILERKYIMRFMKELSAWPGELPCMYISHDASVPSIVSLQSGCKLDD